MAIDNLVITNPMGARMQQKLQARQYDELLEMLIDQRSLFQVLFFCANEDTLIAFYDHYGPSAEDEVCSDDCDFLGNELLLPAYRHGYYRLAARI